MQVSSVPVFQSNVGITSPRYSFHGAQLDGMPPPYMNDQIGNVRPPWYDPFSARYILLYIVRILLHNFVFTLS